MVPNSMLVMTVARMREIIKKVEKENKNAKKLKVIIGGLPVKIKEGEKERDMIFVDVMNLIKFIVNQSYENKMFTIDNNIIQWKYKIVDKTIEFELTEGFLNFEVLFN